MEKSILGRRELNVFQPVEGPSEGLLSDYELSCRPSFEALHRSSFLTGRRPDTIRCYDNPALVRENFPEVVTMPQYFKQHGYLTLGAGKVFHPGNSQVNLIN